MAGIDKIYAPNWEEYKKLLDWAADKVITFENGQSIKVINYIWKYSESEFNPDYAVMSTPVWFDVYLVQNCPIEFVQERLYRPEYMEVEFPPKYPASYQTKRKLKIVRTGTIPLYNAGIYGEGGWCLSCKSNNWWFNEDWNEWVDVSLNYPRTSNVSHHCSVKGVIRFLKKQRLPKGLEFRLIGRYVGEDFTIKIK